MIDNEKDLSIKYLVFKIDDINKHLTEHERNLLWGFLNKIIKSKKSIREFNKGNTTAHELMLEQFKYDVNNFYIPTGENPKAVRERVIELIKKYDL